MVLKSRLTRKLTLSRETLRNLDVLSNAYMDVWTDPTCSTCDPRRPCCPQD
jgi:hypothetical protein